ncbi:MAG TPA: formiminoglutamase, partial [Cytophagales bacterium]|nr:formiminoglutamase [Cytophagales bacterium]
ADRLTFDLASIKSSDAPGSEHAQPIGLTGEEAFHICWYAGLNEKLSSAGFYGYSADFDDEHRKTASVTATMIWYFIEGFYQRKHELNFRSNDFIKYVVAMPQEPETLTFYKSKLTEKWWMEIVPPHAQQYGRNSMVPCSYNDYQQATSGELPERYLTAIAKL